MLEELFNLVKGAAQDNVINNPDVPNEHNNEIVAESTNTVASGLRNMVAGGGAQNLLSLFGKGNQQQSGGGLMNNPLVNMMIGHFAGKLMSKFNLGSGQANNISSSLIPNVLSGLINKSNDPGDSTFSLDNLLHSITGGASSQVSGQGQADAGTGSGIGGMLQQLGGSGGGGLMNIVSKLAGGAQSEQQRNGGGGLMDLIKGFIK